MQCRVALGTPGTGNDQYTLGYGFPVQELEVSDRGIAAEVQNGGGRRGKMDLALDRDQLFQHSGTPHPGKGDQFLLHPAIRKGRDDIRFDLRMHRYHQPIRPPHLDAARVDGAAVQIFGLAFHLHGPRREDELRQIQQLGKRELLLGLAQTRPIFPLIIDHTAQIALQLQLAGLQPLLQHHRPDKALDQLEHRWQIIRDQDLCFQRQLCLEGTVCPRRRQGIPKDLQLHGTRSFPVHSWCHFIPGTGRIERSDFPETQKAAAQRFHCAAALSQSGFGENQVLIQQPWQPRSA